MPYIFACALYPGRPGDQKLFGPPALSGAISKMTSKGLEWFLILFANIFCKKRNMIPKPVTLTIHSKIKLCTSNENENKSR
jgi:hypothetical protein